MSTLSTDNAPSPDYAGLLIDRTDHGWAIYGDADSDELMALLHLWQTRMDGPILVDRAITERLGAALAVGADIEDLADWRESLGLATQPGDDELYAIAETD